MSKVLRTCLTMLVFLSFGTFVYAQTVTGKIASAKGGEPVIGASVSVKGTARGVISDYEGRFSIDMQGAKVLVISSIGFKPVEIEIGSQTQIDVVLKEDLQQLEEVVVTAYGIQKERKALSYSVAEVSSKDLTDASTPNIVDALQGKVAGMDITGVSSGVTGGANITIRGLGSISGNNMPLFVIDGIPIQPGVSGAGFWGGEDFGNDLLNLNTEEFESVSVLKGTAASALYGSRGANGVVLISTKKGVERKGLGVDYSYSVRFEDVAFTPELQKEFGPGYGNPKDFSKQDLWKNRKQPDDYYVQPFNPYSFGPRYNPEVMVYDPYGDLVPYTYKASLEDLYEVGVRHTHNLAINGGNKQTTFRISTSYKDHEGIQERNKLEQLSFGLNLNHKLTERISANIVANYIHTERLNPPAIFEGFGKDYIYYHSSMTDYAKLKDNYKAADGDIRFRSIMNEDLTVPGAIRMWRTYENTRNRLDKVMRNSVELRYKVTDWLTASADASMYILDIQQETKNRGMTNHNTRNGAEYALGESTRREYIYKGRLEVNKSFDDIGLDVSGFLGMERRDVSGERMRARTTDGFLVADRWSLSNSVSTPQIEERNTRMDEERVNSILFTSLIGFHNFVYLDLAYRRDWASTLTRLDGSGDNAYNYYNIGASYVFTDHFTDFDWGILNAGKVNVAFSKAGKGATDPLVSLYDVSFYNGDPYTNGLGGTLRNAYLKPESVYGFEIGTELGFFDNRITIEGTYYKQTTEDQLQNVPIPGYSGASSRYINVASVENTGIEIVLNTVPVRTDEWTWEIGGTYYTNDNELVNLAEDVEEIGIYEWTNWGVFPRARIGEPLGLIRGNGFKYDESGNKLLNVEGYYVQEADKLLGNINPDFTGNIYSRLTFRNFTLSALVDFRVGGELMSGSYFYGTGRGKIKDTLFGRDAEHGGITYIDANGETRRDGIIPEGVFEKGTFLGKGDAQKDVSGWTYQKAVDKGLVTPLAAWDYYSSLGAWGVGIPEIGIFKAGYVRMKQISITYNVPSDFLKRTPFRRFSASAVGRNLFYFSKDMPIGINPEPLSSSNWQNIYEFNGLPATYEVGFTLRASF